MDTLADSDASYNQTARSVTDEDLLAMPSDWRFCPVGFNKSPIGLNGERCPSDWHGYFSTFQGEGLDADYLLSLNGSRPPAIGLLLGPATGTMVIDGDDLGWEDYFFRETGHRVEELPPTIQWSSGKPGRRGIALTVPHEYQVALNNNTHIYPKDENGERVDKAIVELRWDCHQSVVCGFHPQTGGYHWLPGCSPQECPDPGEAPEWLLQVMLKPAEQDFQQYTPTAEDAVEALEIFQKLPPEDFEGYEDWLHSGMAAHHIDSVALEAPWIAWSKKMSNFESEEKCRKKWRSFGKKYPGRKFGIAYLRRRAMRYGHVPRVPSRPGPSYECPIGEAADKPLAEALFDASASSHVIVAADPPGTGKSHAVPHLVHLHREESRGAIGFYVSQGYRSPPVEDIKYFDPVPSRHQGLIKDEVQGEIKLRIRKAKEVADPEHPPTCKYAASFDALRSHGGSSKSVSNACKECPEKQNGCLYIKERNAFRSDLSEQRTTRIRGSINHISTIAKQLGDRWKDVTVIVDEATQLRDALYPTSKISFKQLKHNANWLAERLPDGPERTQYLLLLEAIQELPRCAEGRETMYGMRPNRIISLVGELADGLNVQPFGAEPQSLLTTAEDYVPQEPVILHHIIAALQGADGYGIRSDKTHLHVTRKDTAVQSALQRCACVYVLDGTTNASEIERLVGIENGSAAVVRTATDHGLENLQIVQVQGLGSCGAKRGEDILRDRLPALKDGIRRKERMEWKFAHMECSTDEPIDCVLPAELSKIIGIIDIGAHAQSGEGKWHSDSRGSNAYQDCSALVLIGQPRKNLNAALVEFILMTGNKQATTDDKDFQEWYAQQIGQELIQGIHRLRPIRRQGEALTVYLVCDDDLSGMPFAGAMRFAQAVEFSLSAGEAHFQTLSKLVNAIVYEWQGPGEPTLDWVAQSIGKNRSHLSETLNCEPIKALLVGNYKQTFRNLLDIIGHFIRRCI